MLAVHEAVFDQDPPTKIQDIETGWASPEAILTPRDRQCLRAFDEINAALLELQSAVLSVERNLQEGRNERAETARLVAAQQSFSLQLKHLCRTIFSHDMEALQSIYDLKKQNLELAHSLAASNHALQMIRQSRAYLLARRGRDLYHQLRSRIREMQSHFAAPSALTAAPIPGSTDPNAGSAAGEEKPAGSGFLDEHQFYKVDNPYADVDNSETAFEIFRDWVTIYHSGGRRWGSSKPLVNDQISNIYELDKLFPLAGKRILEIGPLEAANTKQLSDLGASEIVAIESNKQFFLKCLVVQNQFKLKAAEFVYGDCNAVLDDAEFAARGKFDLCYATGVLYHMEDPLRTIDLLVRYSDRIFVWSQVASDDQPAGSWVTVRDSAERTYTGRINSYKATDALGGVGQHAVWLTKDSMFQAFADRGYSIHDLGDRQTYKGQSVTFLATKG